MSNRPFGFGASTGQHFPFADCAANTNGVEHRLVTLFFNQSIGIEGVSFLRISAAAEWRQSRVHDNRAGYLEDTVCTTLDTGRAFAVGIFMSLTNSASYSGSVCTLVLAFICTIL